MSEGSPLLQELDSSPWWSKNIWYDFNIQYSIILLSKAGGAVEALSSIFRRFKGCVYWYVPPHHNGNFHWCMRSWCRKSTCLRNVPLCGHCHSRQLRCSLWSQWKWRVSQQLYRMCQLLFRVCAYGGNTGLVKAVAGCIRVSLTTLCFSGLCVAGCPHVLTHGPTYGPTLQYSSVLTGTVS